jgi:hypothetical protein
MNIMIRVKNMAIGKDIEMMAQFILREIMLMEICMAIGKAIGRMALSFIKVIFIMERFASPGNILIEKVNQLKKSFIYEFT